MIWSLVCGLMCQQILSCNLMRRLSHPYSVEGRARERERERERARERESQLMLG